MKIKENLYLFLISFFTSIIIWYGLTYSSLLKQERWEKIIPLKIEISNKVVLKNLKPDKIKIYGKGYNPKDEEISIVIPIEKTNKGNYKINISKELIKIPQSSEIIKIEPQQVDIELENKIKKDLPFTLPEEILKKYIVTIEPKYVKISGAESILKEIKDFKIPLFQVPKTIPTNLLLPLSPPQKDIEIISPLTIEIKIEGRKK